MKFFFYDLETSGFSPSLDRIMQFAAQLTDADFKPLAKPVNVLVRLSDDILPSPDAVLVHGITPQQTLDSGILEAEFSALLEREMAIGHTVVVGYNNCRFDDEFIRYTLYRNLRDPYKWQYQDGRSRWDLLDVGRMMRALRPEGVNWPFNQQGEPSNRLEDLARVNKLSHTQAHDALSDVQATIELAKLFKRAQPKLFNYLFQLRKKEAVRDIIRPGSLQPFVYSSGAYGVGNLATTVAVSLASHPDDRNSFIVYDLRFNPEAFLAMNPEELRSRLFLTAQQREETEPLPVKKIALNRVPAVAPLGTLDDAAQQRIHLPLETALAHLKAIKRQSQFINNIIQAYKSLPPYPSGKDPEARLYDGFFPEPDKSLLKTLVSKKPRELAGLTPDFIDQRLPTLFFRYKARNYPEILTDEENRHWQSWRQERLLGKSELDGMDLIKFQQRLAELAPTVADDAKKMFLLEELRLYAQSIAPDSVFA